MLTQCIGLIADLIAIGGIPTAGYQIYKGRKEARINNERREKEERRKNDPITIILEETKGIRKICLANKVRRGIMTRSEVLGRLGMIPIKPAKKNQAPQQNRFQINYTSSAEFVEAVDHIYVSISTELIVFCKSPEIDQFDVEEMRKHGFNLNGFV